MTGCGLLLLSSTSGESIVARANPAKFEEIRPYRCGVGDVAPGDHAGRLLDPDGRSSAVCIVGTADRTAQWVGDDFESFLELYLRDDDEIYVAPVS